MTKDIQPAPQASDGDTNTAPLSRLVVIGAGTMGVGIAYVAASAGYQVELVEVDAARRAAARRTLSELWDRAVSRAKVTATAAEAGHGRISWPAALADLADAPDVVIEAVPERLELKRRVLSAAAAKRPKLLASNTSSISISALSESLACPDRLVGLHFFNPVWAMPLVEIVISDTTSAESRAAALTVVATLGKDPVVVRDLPGFATSRLGVAVGLEAIRMVADGVASAADIDKAMVLGYRHPMGPLELTDIVGLDVRLDIATTLCDAYGERFAPPALLVDMVARGHLGRKSGQGFYQWINGVRHD